MKRFFTLEYRQDDDCFVGKLKEIPGVFSQGKTIEELKENMIDAYRMMLQDYDVIF
ncbi:MAG: type II toxin-antitoxin system HicB family antitoxin [Phycisphaerae bacterium]